MIIQLDLNDKEVCRIIEMRLSTELVKHEIVPDWISVTIDKAGASFVIYWKVSVWRATISGEVVIVGSSLYYGSGLDKLCGSEFGGNWNVVSDVVCDEAVSAVRVKRVATNKTSRCLDGF